MVMMSIVVFWVAGPYLVGAKTMWCHNTKDHNGNVLITLRTAQMHPCDKCMCSKNLFGSACNSAWKLFLISKHVDIHIS